MYILIFYENQSMISNEASLRKQKDLFVSLYLKAGYKTSRRREFL